MNLHKRCQKNVANNCGINPKQIALILQQLGVSDGQQPNTSSLAGQTNNAKPYKAVRFTFFLFAP